LRNVTNRHELIRLARRKKVKFLLMIPSEEPRNAAVGSANVSNIEFVDLFQYMSRSDTPIANIAPEDVKHLVVILVGDFFNREFDPEASKARKRKASGESDDDDS
jgi:hypothetical protein